MSIHQNLIFTGCECFRHKISFNQTRLGKVQGYTENVRYITIKNRRCKEIRNKLTRFMPDAKRLCGQNAEY